MATFDESKRKSSTAFRYPHISLEFLILSSVPRRAVFEGREIGTEGRRTSRFRRRRRIKSG